MKGGFPPYTPTLHMNGAYKNAALRAECYFASVLATKRGLVGIISRNVQNDTGKTTDQCVMYVNETKTETLVFPAPAAE